MNGDVHVRFCEGLGVKFPRATHPAKSGRSMGIYTGYSYVQSLIPCRRVGTIPLETRVLDDVYGVSSGNRCAIAKCAIHGG